MSTSATAGGPRRAAERLIRWTARLSSDTVHLHKTSLFVATARESYARVEQLAHVLGKAIDAKSKNEPLDLPIVQRISGLFHDLDRFAMTTIVFSAIAAESVIVAYAARAKSISYVKQYLEKLDLPAKWVIIPKLVANYEFPTNGQAFQLLKRLYAARNSLVHPKVKSFDLANVTFDELASYFAQHHGEAEASIKTLDALAKAAEFFDPSGFIEAHLVGSNDP